MAYSQHRRLFHSLPSSELSSPVESVTGSTETESEDEEHLAGLTRQIARFTLEEDFLHHSRSRYHCRCACSAFPSPPTASERNISEFMGPQNHVPLYRHQPFSHRKSQPMKFQRHFGNDTQRGFPFCSPVTAMPTGFPRLRRQSGGTGVFLPRHGIPIEQQRKPVMSSEVLLPEKVVRALNLNFGAIKSFPTDEGSRYLSMDLLSQQRGNTRPQGKDMEVGLPQEWTY